ncbi:hypothetical protein LP421_23910 [Rhizobium sp. RCAM05350]|nr:hypothetical protein LP421_23910 [Rhizobium sp. RCAM05350]
MKTDFVLPVESPAESAVFYMAMFRCAAAGTVAELCSRPDERRVETWPGEEEETAGRHECQ